MIRWLLRTWRISVRVNVQRIDRAQLVDQLRDVIHDIGQELGHDDDRAIEWISRLAYVATEIEVAS